MRAGGVLLIAVLAGCGGGNDQADAGIDAAPPCFNYPGTRRLRAEAHKYGSMGGGPFGGFICVEGHPELQCSTADTNTQFSLCVPESGDFGVRLKNTGWDQVVFLFGQGMLPPGPSIESGNDEWVKMTSWDPIGGVYPPTTNSNLIFFLYFKDPTTQLETPLAGATVTIEPSAGLTVTYTQENSMADPTLTATSNHGGVQVANVPPGMYDLTVTSSAVTSCKNAYGGGYASTTGTVKIPAIAGATVEMFIECAP